MLAKHVIVVCCVSVLSLPLLIRTVSPSHNSVAREYSTALFAESKTQFFANSGLFLPYTFYTDGPSHTIFSKLKAIAIGDLNGDGRNDVVLTTSFLSNPGVFDPQIDGFLFVFMQNAAGGFDPPVKYKPQFLTFRDVGLSVDVGDVNGDGRADVVLGMGEAVEVFLQEPTGKLAPPVVYPSINSGVVKIGDLNNDGRMDIAGFAYGASIWYQNSNGGLNPPVTYDVRPAGRLDDMAIADLNNDGRQDLILTGPDDYRYANLYVMVQKTDGSLAPAATYNLPPNDVNVQRVNAGGLAVGDVNGDGLDDVILTYHESPFYIGVFLQNRAGTLDPAVLYRTYNNPSAVSVADFNGDGIKDVAVAHAGWEAVGVYLQGPDGKLAPEELYPAPYAISAGIEWLTAGDINGDGKNDLLMVSPQTARLVIFYNTPSGGERPSLSITSPAGGESLKPGTTHNITWTTTGNVGDVRIDYSVDDGDTWLSIAASAPNTGNYQWIVPDLGSTTCLVRIFERKGRVWDVSANFFSIESCNASIFPTSEFFNLRGVTSNVIFVYTGKNCDWTASKNADWITLGLSNGRGNGYAGYAIGENYSVGQRTGTITLAGKTFTAVQGGEVATVSAASYQGTAVAPESIVVAFGSGLAPTSQAAITLPLPTTIIETLVLVTDSRGTQRPAPLFFVSPGQINFQIPPETAPGKAGVSISGFRVESFGTIQIERVAPGLFATNADGQGVAAAVALRYNNGRLISAEPVAQFDQTRGKFTARPIELGPEGDQVFLALFGTGIRNRSSLSAVGVEIGGVNSEVVYAGAQGDFTGLDQINVRIPRTLAGRGEASIALRADGQLANTVTISIR